MAIKYREPCAVFSPQAEDEEMCSICLWSKATHAHTHTLVGGVCSQCSADPVFAALVEKAGHAIERAVEAIGPHVPVVDGESDQNYYDRKVFIVRTSLMIVDEVMKS